MEIKLPDFLSEDDLDSDDVEGSAMTVISLVIGTAAAGGIVAVGLALRDRIAELVTGDDDFGGDMY